MRGVVCGDDIRLTRSCIVRCLAQLWACRLSLLCHLGMFDAASSEMEEFGDLDKVDLCFEYYPGKYMHSTGEDCKCHVMSCHVGWCCISDLDSYNMCVC